MVQTIQERVIEEFWMTPNIFIISTKKLSYSFARLMQTIRQTAPALLNRLIAQFK